MLDREQRLSRRKFMASAAGMGVAAAASGHADADATDAPPPLSRTRPAKLSLKGRKPLAVVTTVYRPLSHAYHIAGRFIHGYALGGKLHVPKQYVALDVRRSDAGERSVAQTSARNSASDHCATSTKP